MAKTKLSVASGTNRDDSAAEMRHLGFTDYEARIYIQLLKASPATAYEISKEAGVPRPNTYNALQSLAQRGAVLPVSENPVRYVAADPDQMLDAIARQTQALCEDLKRDLSGLAAPTSDQYVWTIKGEAEVHAKIDQMITSSKKCIWIKASEDILRRHKAALAAAANSGVRNLIIIYGTAVEEFTFTRHCQVYIHEGNGMRMGIADNLFTITVDHAEALTASGQDDVEAAHTRSRLVVVMADSLLRHDYYMAEICTRFGKEIFAEFGPHLRDLRFATYSSEQIDVFKQRTGQD